MLNNLYSQLTWVERDANWNNSNCEAIIITSWF